VKAIESELGLSKESTQMGAIGNFPLITDKHRSLMAKALKTNPELYSKYAGKKTPMGFTFDQAIQAGLDAPHLGVGIAAGEAASYEVYKDIMDIVIEGWHGYKPSDSHK
jgi:creatine kinase